ncbi:RidA family protein [Inhella gelatinilytica]|uniref:RidA family protein n=1 Tax=Inhella gelatinilytica TaxID=2795030 RepID=A0A931NC61_9BURK|nr:RidA family protein [Inhella gelatinilytica]MBH9554343.1 RidA family protein [Inhella gelatinilytica]
MNSSPHQTVLPEGWKRPRGYANGVLAQGRHLHVAGMIGWDAQEQIVSDDFLPQACQALANVLAVLAAAGAGPEHIVRMTWYVTDKREYLAAGRELGAWFKAHIGHYAMAMSAVQVVALMEDRAKVEIEVTAVLPD